MVSQRPLVVDERKLVLYMYAVQRYQKPVDFF
jgi:hypothetical protein